MSFIIYDLIPLAVLLLFAFRGARRGLIRTLFSLLALLVALVGAILVSNHWAAPVSGWLQPTMRPAVESAVESALPDGIADAELPSGQLLLLLKQTELPMGLNRFLEDAQEEDVLPGESIPLSESLTDFLSTRLADAAAHIGLFLLSFFLILILWHLLARALDLVAHLPGLKTLNQLGGFLLGILRGALLLFIAAWLIRWLWSDLIPADVIDQTRLIRFFMTTNPMDYLTKI